MHHIVFEKKSVSWDPWTLIGSGGKRFTERMAGYPIIWNVVLQLFQSLDLKLVIWTAKIVTLSKCLLHYVIPVNGTFKEEENLFQYYLQKQAGIFHCTLPREYMAQLSLRQNREQSTCWFKNEVVSVLGLDSGYLVKYSPLPLPSAKGLYSTV